MKQENLYDKKLKDMLVSEMQRIFGEDIRRINHAMNVLSYALKILAKEGGNGNVVVASAILHDIGIHEAERKYGDCSGVYQEIEGPLIAGPILKRTMMLDDDIKHILKIIANHHSARDIDTLEFRILWDADWLVNFYDLLPAFKGNKELLEEKINHIFKTVTGRTIAKTEFIINNKLIKKGGNDVLFSM